MLAWLTYSVAGDQPVGHALNVDFKPHEGEDIWAMRPNLECSFTTCARSHSLFSGSRDCDTVFPAPLPGLYAGFRLAKQNPRTPGGRCARIVYAGCAWPSRFEYLIRYGYFPDPAIHRRLRRNCEPIRLAFISVAPHSLWRKHLLPEGRRNPPLNRALSSDPA